MLIISGIKLPLNHISHHVYWWEISIHMLTFVNVFWKSLISLPASRVCFFFYKKTAIRASLLFSCQMTRQCDSCQAPEWRWKPITGGGVVCHTSMPPFFVYLTLASYSDHWQRKWIYKTKPFPVRNKYTCVNTLTCIQVHTHLRNIKCISRAYRSRKVTRERPDF